jgi:hypothetical protein
MSDTKQSIYAHGGSQIYPSMSPSREPLMHVMSKASGALLDATFGNATSRECWAAEIRALRDWLVPFEEVQGPYVNGPLGWVINTEEQHRCDERQRLRALLTAEAERAENGEE